MKEKIVYTVDDEEPSCGRCDNALMPDKQCMKNCGGANWWAGYRRIEMIVGKEDEIS